MARPYKIGFLQPYSSLYPHFAEHLLTGFFVGFGRDPFRQDEVQFVPAFTGSGTVTSITEGLQRLIQFDRVDFLSGLISYASLPDITPFLERYQRYALFFDLGEYLPMVNYLSPYTFFNSHQLWQAEYALGKWAAEEFDQPAMMVMPLYDAGYHLHSAFQQGMAAGTHGRGGQYHLQVIKSPTDNPHVLDLPPVLQAIREKKPSFVHAIFSGPAGNEFLHAWVNEGLHKQIPLLVNENMTYQEWLGDVAHLGLELYTTSLYNKDSEDPRNKLFRRQFQQVARQDVSIFSLLGYEGGLLFKEIFPYLQAGDVEKARLLMETNTICGPRGERTFYPDAGFKLPDIDVVKLKTTHHGTTATIVAQGTPLAYNHTVFNDIRQAMPSGWKNPYCCI